VVIRDEAGQVLFSACRAISNAIDAEEGELLGFGFGFSWRLEQAEGNRGLRLYMVGWMRPTTQAFGGTSLLAQPIVTMHLSGMGYGPKKHLG
jgi:hypothetical protein